jgi:hypothetical protein
MVQRRTHASLQRVRESLDRSRTESQKSGALRRRASHRGLLAAERSSYAKLCFRFPNKDCQPWDKHPLHLRVVPQFCHEIAANCCNNWDCIFRMGGTMNLSSLSLMLMTVALTAALPAQATFSSASGVPPGSTQSDPVYPSSSQWTSASGQLQYYGGFFPPAANQWYSTTIEPGGLWLQGIHSAHVVVFGDASFTSITAPEGFGAMTIKINETVLDADFNAGEIFTFASSVNVFDISLNSTPSFQPGTSAANSFQLKLGIAGSPVAMAWFMRAPAPVPETSTFVLTLLGFVSLSALTSLRRRKAR